MATIITEANCVRINNALIPKNSTNIIKLSNGIRVQDINGPSQDILIEGTTIDGIQVANVNALFDFFKSQSFNTPNGVLPESMLSPNQFETLPNGFIGIRTDYLQSLNLSGGGQTPYWNGRTVTFFGDSFTQMDLFATTVSTNLNLSGIYEDGVSGSCVVPGVGTVPLQSGVSRIDNSLVGNPTEAYFILMGTNDWAASVPLGAINDPATYTVVNGVVTVTPAQNTFYAALKYVFGQASAARPGRVFVSTMMVRTDQQSNYAGQYTFAQAVKDVAALYSIPVYDMLNDSGITYANISTYSSDLIHPDLPAGKALISAVITAFMTTEGVALNPQSQLGQSTLTVGNITANSVSLSWTAVASSGVYSIRRSTQANLSGAIEVFNSNDMSFTDSTVQPSTTYYYTVVPLATGHKPGIPSSIQSVTTLAGADGMVPILNLVDINSNLTLESNRIDFNGSGLGVAVGQNQLIPAGWIGIIQMDAPIITSSGLFGLQSNITGSSPSGFISGIKYNYVNNTQCVINGIALGSGLNNYSILEFSAGIIPKLRNRFTGVRIFVEYSLDSGATWTEIEDSTTTPIVQPQEVSYVTGYLDTTGTSINNMLMTPIVAPGGNS